jgi:hypothetical protein
MNELLVTKASGEKEPFSREKLGRSLQKAGVPPQIAGEVVKTVESRLRPGISTRELYRTAFTLLKKFHRPTAARYRLKQAITEMGPTGYPFEKLVGEILSAQGYEVKVAQLVKGHCVTHEVDVVAKRANRRLMVECKFHNGGGTKSDIKVVLYVWARFEDIRRAWQERDGKREYFNQAWLVTNTKLTSDAIRYAECMGLYAVSWEYPPGESLPALIDKAGLHPLTALTGLTSQQKRQLMQKGIILCTELDRAALTGIGISGGKSDAILKEMAELCRRI